jgi:hypothetical protein
MSYELFADTRRLFVTPEHLPVHHCLEGEGGKPDTTE